MRLLLAAALTLVLSACSTMGLNSPSASGSLDPLHDDVGSLLIAFDLPRGLGPNNAAGQLFTFDVPQGGPTEHLRLLLVPADADLAAGHLPPPAEGRAYYLYTLDGAARAQIQAAQATANARAVPGKSVQIGVVPQQYLPDELRGRRYYEPTNHGQERDVQARLEKIRRILAGER